MNLSVILKTVHCFCNILCSFVARNTVKYIFKISMERAPGKTHCLFSVGACRSMIWPNTFSDENQRYTRMQSDSTTTLSAGDPTNELGVPTGKPP